MAPASTSPWSRCPRWQTLIDTAAQPTEEEAGHLALGEQIDLPGRSARLLIRRGEL
jgi:hypothetical protein